MKVCRLKKRQASNFDRLDEDLVVEILVRLPVKSVYGCKSVSKRWSNIISTRYFISCYCTGTTPSFGLYYQNCGPWQFDKTIPDTVSVAYATKNKEEILKNTRGFCLEFMPNPIRVLASNNGLVLCSDALVFQKKYYVCNPLTRSWIDIPPPPSAGLKWARVGFLCSDSNSSSSSCFRIVRVANYGKEDDDPSIVKAEIYSSETARWAESDLGDGWNKGYELLMFMPYDSTSKFMCSELNAIVFRGLLHWSNGLGPVFVYDPNNNNNNKVVQLPYKSFQLPRPPSHNIVRYLGESSKGENLMYISFECRTFNVWELKHYDNNGDWGLLYDICLDQMVFRQQVRGCYELMACGDLSFLAFHPFNKHVVFICFRHQVLSFNLCKKTIKTVGRVASSPWYSDYHSMPYLVVLPW